jgi:ABC-type dipeptide/oligopeptide/nickel transport system permease component
MFAKDAVQGDLGRSVFSNQPVTTQILEQLPSTMQLTLAAMIVSLLVGIPLGVFAAVRHGTWMDSVSMAISLVGATMPSFWIGLLFIFLFSSRLGWLPASGTAGFKSLIMPSVTLGLYSSAVIARLTRTSMLEVFRQDYVVTARAKGLSERTTILRHALRNALLPVVTVVGLQISYLLGGAVITETVFARQGIGQLAVGAVLQRDGPLVQGTVLFLAVVFVIANLLVDISYAVLDPRIRYR